MEDKDLFILYIQYHGCWWSGNARGQGINSHDIHLVLEYSAFGTRGFNSGGYGYFVSVNWVFIDSCKCLVSVWFQVITWTSASLLSIGHLGTSLRETSMKIWYKKMHLKMFTKLRTFYSRLNMLIFPEILLNVFCVHSRIMLPIGRKWLGKWHKELEKFDMFSPILCSFKVMSDKIS